jgi:hypothetical protein
MPADKFQNVALPTYSLRPPMSKADPRRPRPGQALLQLLPGLAGL